MEESSRRFSAAQKRILAVLVAALERCPAGGSVEVRPYQGRRGGGMRVEWPPPGPSRAEWKELLLADLAGRRTACRVVYRPADAAGKDARSYWDWPASGDLFADQVAEETAAAQDVPVCEAEVVEPAEDAPAEAGGEIPPLNEMLEDLRAKMGDAADERADLYSEACARDILRLLQHAGRRLSLSDLTERMATIGREWSYSAVSHTAPRMRREGQLDNQKDARGKGYGLPQWGNPQEVWHEIAEDEEG